jgi:hypothetical protein
MRYAVKYKIMTVPSNLDIQLGLAKIKETLVTRYCDADNKEQAIVKFNMLDSSLNWLTADNVIELQGVA